MRFRPILALLLALIPCQASVTAAVTDRQAAPGPADRPDPHTEEGLSVILDAQEARYEAAGVRLSEALWRWWTESGDHAAVHEARRALLAVYEDPGFLEVLHAWNERRTLTRDPSLSRRVAIWVRTGPLARVELDPDVGDLRDSLASRLAAHRYRLDGKPTDPDALRTILATSDDAGLRRRAWVALITPGMEIVADLKALNRLRAVRSREIGAGMYHKLVYHVGEQNNNWLSLILHTIKRRTGAATRDLYARLREAMGTEELKPWDLARGMERLSEKSGARALAARYLPAGEEEAAADRLLRAVGIEFSTLGFLRSKGDHAPGGASLAARIPGDFRRVESPRTDVGPAETTLERILRMRADVIRTSFTTRTEPMLKGYDWIPGTSNAFWSEGIAEFLAAFDRDPQYLHDVVGMKPDEIRIFTQDLRDRNLLRLRRILLNMSWEQVMFINPDADLDVRYREQYGAAMGMPLDPADPLPWTVEPRFIRRPVSWYAELASLGIAADAHALMREEIGEGRFSSPKVGPWLESRLGQGESVPMEYRLANSLRAGFDLDRYLGWLVPAPRR